MNLQLHYLLVNRSSEEEDFMSSLDFSEIIRDRRNELDKTQKEAAELVGVSPETYGRIERGTVSPTLRQIRMILRAFGLKWNEVEEAEPEKLSATDCLNRVIYYAEQAKKLLR